MQRIRTQPEENANPDERSTASVKSRKSAQAKTTGKKSSAKARTKASRKKSAAPKKKAATSKKAAAPTKSAAKKSAAKKATTKKATARKSATTKKTAAPKKPVAKAPIAAKPGASPKNVRSASLRSWRYPDVAIVGAYNTVQAKRIPNMTEADLVLDAVRGALADAGMQPSDVDGVNVSTWVSRLNPRVVVQWFGGRPSWTGTSHPGIESVLEAAAAIQTGQCETVVLATAQCGEYTLALINI